MHDQTTLFSDGVAVVTGAASGIGEGLARHAASIGMKVVLADIAADRLEAVVQDILETGAEAVGVITDVSDVAQIESLVSTTLETWGAPRVLFNNAGIETLGFSWELSAEQWHKALSINIEAAVQGSRAFLPHMLASGEKCWLANTASIGGLGMMPIQTSYIMSKHALISFSECLRLEMMLKKAPVCVSAILPGPVATRVFEDAVQSNDKTASFHRNMMDAMLTASGISPSESAKIIFDQLAEDQFWISTHPELTQALASNRANYLSMLDDPTLPPDTEQMLGIESVDGGED